MKDFKICSLEKNEDLYPLLAWWSYNEWFEDTNLSYDIIRRDYKRRMNSSVLPCTFAAFDKKQRPVGMVSLKLSDLQSRKDLTPWLSALYVVPEFRNKGIGSELVQYLCKNAAKRCMREIFLFVDLKNEKILVDFYENLGWSYHSTGFDHNGENVKIYTKKL